MFQIPIRSDRDSQNDIEVDFAALVSFCHFGSHRCATIAGFRFTISDWIAKSLISNPEFTKIWRWRRDGYLDGDRRGNRTCSG
jgi:hypothetical protein